MAGFTAVVWNSSSNRCRKPRWNRSSSRLPPCIRSKQWVFYVLSVVRELNLFATRDKTRYDIFRCIKHRTNRFRTIGTRIHHWPPVVKVNRRGIHLDTHKLAAKCQEQQVNWVSIMMFFGVHLDSDIYLMSMCAGGARGRGTTPFSVEFPTLGDIQKVSITRLNVACCWWGFL